MILLRGVLLPIRVVIWAGGWHIHGWGSNKDNPLLHGGVRNVLRCGLGDILLSVPSIVHRAHVSELRCGYHKPGLFRSIRPHTQCRASSNCNVWRVHPAQSLVAEGLPHHLCVHSSGRNTDHIWPHHRRPGFLR